MNAGPRRADPDGVSDPLPATIVVRPLPEGTAYVLPRRPLGRARWVAVILMVIGTGFAVVPMGRAILPVLSGARSLSFAIGDLMMSAVFLSIGAPLALLGLAASAGRSSIVVGRDAIVAEERVGPLRWRRRAPLSGLRRIRVERASAESASATSGPINPVVLEIAALRAEIEGRKPMMLALGYPVSWLLPLAERLTEEARAAAPDRLVGGDDEIRVEVVEHRLGDEKGDEAPGGGHVPQPPASRITLTENSDGVTLVIPPAGIRKGSSGLFGFAVLWCAFMVVFTGFAVFGAASGQSGSNVWPFVGGCALFWAIGIGLLLGAINMGSRRAIIDVVDDVLLVNRKSLFGLKSHQFARDEVDAVFMGESGMSVNDVPVQGLRIRPKRGAPLCLFAGRDTDELRWLAWVIRTRLNLPG